MPALFPLSPSQDRLSHWLDIMCDFGGRRSGSASERAASAFLGERLAASGGRYSWQDDAFSGWAPDQAIILCDGVSYEACTLLNSPATAAGGISAPVLDLGRGTPEDFAKRAAEIAGKIILVSHELMFSAETVHRRVKYAAATEYGAAALLVVGHQPGSVVAGSTGMAAHEGIPAAGIAPETARALVKAGRAQLTIRLAPPAEPPVARSHFVEFGPESGPVTLLSAHFDGHDPAEAALDNASGCAILLALIEQLAKAPPPAQRLRFCFFNLEEWRLTGSRNYVASLSEAERDEIILNINLDSLGLPGVMTALTSGFEKLGPFLSTAFAGAGEDLQIHLPFQANSDHANFAEAGIPAFRLFAGFDDPGSPAVVILSGGDNRDRVSLPDLERAAGAVAATIAAASGIDPKSLR